MTHIAPSELILNPDGSIYHLGVRPGELATTIITVGDPERVAKVSRHFDSIEVKRQKREFITHTGFIGNRRITVMSSGIGPDNIDIVINECDAIFNIDLETKLPKTTHQPLNFIRLGTSGCIQPDIAVDNILVSEYGIGLDGMLAYYKRDLSEDEVALEKAFYDHCASIDLPLKVQVAKAHHPKMQIPSNIHRGITLTCAGFYGPQSRQLRAAPKAPGLLDHLSSFKYKKHPITNLEMESAAIFGLCNILGHRSIAINTLIANRANLTFSKDPKKAVAGMITSALGWIVEG